MAKPLPPVDELFERFYVDSTSPTGLRYARTFGGRSQKDNVAGSVDISSSRSGGYCKVWIGNGSYKTHRVVLAMTTGKDRPDMEVDHIDRNKGNNHPFNLRWASRKRNVRNRDVSGVSRDPRCKTKPFSAELRYDGKRVRLGYYATRQEAHQAYLNAVHAYQQP